MRNNKKVTRLLLSLVVLIWGAVGYQLISGSGSEASDISSETIGSANTKEGASVTEYAYLTDVRDPFQTFLPKLASSSKAKAFKSPPAALTHIFVPPPYKLNGIVNANKKKTALLESSDGAVYFLNEGDSVQGIKILTIGRNTVIYTYSGRQQSWQIN